MEIRLDQRAIEQYDDASTASVIIEEGRWGNGLVLIRVEGNPNSMICLKRRELEKALNMLDED